MRPRYLEIEGLQSFKSVQKIDFDKLGETGLFGIFGPTGSGKSTVLDAITLALYGNVERASHGTQGIINTDMNNVKVSFVFDLLKDNTRKTYRVERVYRRKKGSENSAENKMARLFEVIGDETFIIADRLSDVNNNVEELIGLQLNDFTRSVVLPQNKFQEFLLLEKAKKREMLERIFYLEEYGRQLTDKVSKRLSTVKSKLDNVQGAMSALGDASGEDLKEAESKMEAALVQKEKIDKELKLVETQFNEKKEIWGLVEELKSVTDKEQGHLAILDQINEKKKLYEDSVKAEGLKEFIEKYRETDKNLAETRVRLEVVLKELPGLQQQLNEARKEHDEKHGEIEVEKPKLIEQKTKLNNAITMKKELLDIETRLKALRNEYNAFKKKIADKDNAIKAGKAEIEEIESLISEHKLNIEKSKVSIDYRKEIQAGAKLEEDLKNAEKGREAHQIRYNELSDRILELNKEFEVVNKQRQMCQEGLKELNTKLTEHVNSKPGDRNELMKHAEKYRRMLLVCETLASKNAEIDRINVKLADAEFQIKRYKEMHKKKEDEKNTLEIELNGINQEIDNLKNCYEENTAYMFAKNLKDNEPCPVCGSTHHPNPVLILEEEGIEEVEQHLRQSREKQVQIEKKLRKTETECIQINEKLKHLDEQMSHITDDLTAKKNEYNLLIVTLPEDMKNMKLNVIDEELKNIIQQSDKKLITLDDWERNHKEIETSILNEREILSQQIIEENKKRTEVELNKESLERQKKSLNEANQNFGDKLEWYREFTGRLGIQNAANELKRIEENDHNIEELQKRITELQESVKNIRNKLELLSSEKEKLGSKFAQIEAEGQSFRVQMEEKERKMDQLTGGKDIDVQLEDIDKTMHLFTRQEKQLREKVEKLEQQFNEKYTQKSTLENQKIIFEKNMESEARRLQAMLKEKGFESVDGAEKCLLPEEERDKLNADIREYEHTQRNLEMVKYILVRKLNNRSITEDEWNAVSENYQAKKKEKEESISLYESMKNEYKRIKENYNKWVKLDKELKVYNGKNEMLMQIQKLLRGNSFIEYISEERLRYIAKEASETLGVLTKYRYALELDTEHGFVIRDYANGGVHRIVSSLSGGETFLTSLSLALALSKQIQLKGQSPLEFFFLDEGFGTLDSNLLDIVIDALERLSTKERVIGLISHVPELKNRIARRLIVEPPTSDGKGSRVRIEKA